MDDSGWEACRTAWERLKWARLRQFETAKAAADSLRMKEDTYSAYERPPGDGVKHTRLNDQRAIEFGAKFKTNWVWLLTGDDTPFARTPAQERTLRLMAQAEAADQEMAARMVETLLTGARA